MKKIAQAIVEESAQLDGVQPEEMLREVATSLNGESSRPYHGVGEVVAHRGVEITEDIVRNITVAVFKEGFYPLFFQNVPLFPGTTAIQQAELIPMPPYEPQKNPPTGALIFTEREPLFEEVE